MPSQAPPPPVGGVTEATDIIAGRGAKAAAPAAPVAAEDDMRSTGIHAVPTAGDQVRIGTVYAGSTSRLRVPATAIGGDGTVNIVARIFPTSRVVRTGRVPIAPGQALEVTLPSSENTLTILPANQP